MSYPSSPHHPYHIPTSTHTHTKALPATMNLEGIEEPSTLFDSTIYLAPLRRAGLCPSPVLFLCKREGNGRGMGSTMTFRLPEPSFLSSFVSFFRVYHCMTDKQTFSCRCAMRKHIRSLNVCPYLSWIRFMIRNQSSRLSPDLGGFPL